ncbi:hypothetical protein GCM10023333_05650 [Ferrimonas pelagia]|uniref:Porin domain-containing protein n=2 Tax=Ferrimonas pelagia TaxID=1177826 RepID=A0ABP9EE70_9GAMM
MASDINMNISGKIGIHSLLQSGKDLQTSTYLSSITGNGNYSSDWGNVITTFTGDYSDYANDENKVNIREASMVIKTKKFGSFYSGKGQSGQYNTMYKYIDVHNFNSFHPDTSSQLFRQSQYGNNVFAYISPWLETAYGKFQTRVSVPTPFNESGNTFDVLSARLLYNHNNFIFRVNRVETSKEALSQENNYVRWASVVGHQWQHLHAAFLFESGKHDPKGYEDVFGLALTGLYENWKLAISLQSESRSDQIKNRKISIASATYYFDEHFSLFLEGANYSEAINNNSDSNLSLGIVMNF